MRPGAEQDEIIAFIRRLSGKSEPRGDLGRLLIWIRAGHDAELMSRAVRAMRQYDPARGGRTVQDIIRRFLRAREPSCAEFMLTLAQALEQYALDQGGEQGA